MVGKSALTLKGSPNPSSNDTPSPRGSSDKCHLPSPRYGHRVSDRSRESLPSPQWDHRAYHPTMCPHPEVHQTNAICPHLVTLIRPLIVVKKSALTPKGSSSISPPPEGIIGISPSPRGGHWGPTMHKSSWLGIGFVCVEVCQHTSTRTHPWHRGCPWGSATRHYHLPYKEVKLNECFFP